MKRTTAFIISALIAMITVSAVTAQTAPSEIFRQEGIASWYGPEFDGRTTASGEIFSSALLTAAHPTLPFGTLLNVTNTYNNREVTVKVNDRGPFVAARIIDLSMAAAEALDMLSTGTAPVIIETAGTAAIVQSPVIAEPAAPIPPTQTTVPPPAQATAVPAAPPPALEPARPPAVRQSAVIIGGIPAYSAGRTYRLQVGSYKVTRNAVEAFQKLEAVGLKPSYEQAGDLYRVVLAGLKPEDIPLAAEQLFSAGYAEALIREER